MTFLNGPVQVWYVPEGREVAGEEIWAQGVKYAVNVADMQGLEGDIEA